MDRERAVRDYIDSWLDRDLDGFLCLLAPDVLVVESYGPVYEGLAECRSWFENWHAAPANGRVTRWDIFRIFLGEDGGSAFCDWDFQCDYEGRAGGFLGASLFVFSGGRIAQLHEYKTEREQYRPYRV